jgi:hypothetical protein
LVLVSRLAFHLASIFWHLSTGIRRATDEGVMKTKFLALLLLAGSSLFAHPRVFFGVGFGPTYGGYGYYVAPPPPPVYAYAPAPAAVYPGPGYVFINGYYGYGPYGYRWVPGYYSRPPFVGAYWIGPRYYGGRYYAGYWGRRR